jgi:hypothetical protein
MRSKSTETGSIASVQKKQGESGQLETSKHHGIEDTALCKAIKSIVTKVLKVFHTTVFLQNYHVPQDVVDAFFGRQHQRKKGQTSTSS